MMTKTTAIATNHHGEDDSCSSSSTLLRSGIASNPEVVVEEEEALDDSDSTEDDDDDDHDQTSTNGGAGMSMQSSGGASSSSCSEPTGSIAKSETVAVLRLRVLTILVLVLTASLVSGVVLSITRRGEMEEFESQFEGAAHVLEVSFQGILDKLSMITTMGVVHTTSTTSSQTWPFKTLDHFVERAASARALSGALQIDWCPLVTIDHRDDWEHYVNIPQNNAWIHRSMDHQEQLGQNQYETNTELILKSILDNTTTVDPIKYFDDQGQAHLELANGPYLTIWQSSPLLQRRLINHNLLSPVDPLNRTAQWATAALASHQAILGGIISAPHGMVSDSNKNPLTSTLATLYSIAMDTSSEVHANNLTHYHYLGEPLSYFYVPVFDDDNDDDDEHRWLLTFSVLEDEEDAETASSNSASNSANNKRQQQEDDQDNRVAVGLLQSLIPWRSYFRHNLPHGIPSISLVLHSSCNNAIAAGADGQQQQQQYTYDIQGQEAYIVGFGDHHDPAFNRYEHKTTFSTFHLTDGTVNGLNLSQTLGCQYSIAIYPTQSFMDAFNTDTPLAITFAIAIVFIFTICLFLFYDRLVEQRQNIVMAQAAHTTAIVSSLFPKNVRDRLLDQNVINNKDQAGGAAAGGASSLFAVNKSRLKGFLNDGDNNNDCNQAPIADLFPECTVFFGDIAGFTAWSSTREPEQVFILLQTVYQTFDSLAKRRKVFKVETIGDSYMAVTGLPEPMIQHAATMVRFAWDCRNEFHRVTKDLEVTLGPDTGDLAMRFGLHSGPVTAGVLRGDRARFQLFGDTVNTASRMESTGTRDRVHISASTAELLEKAGKGSWLRKREDPVHAKGKGMLTTFWAVPSKHAGSSISDGDSGSNPDTLKSSFSGEAAGATGVNSNSQKHLASTKKVNQRLVDWMADLLLDHTKKVVYSRRHAEVKESSKSGSGKAPTYHPPEGTTCMDEFKDVIEMPNFNAKLTDINQNYKNAKIPESVIVNLRAYVARIACCYRDNPFHNFEHACHVTMSVTKLLKRIVAPEMSHYDLQKLKKVDDIASHLHDYTHGINSDPLLAFAITLSALMHDVDHRGVANSRLIEEEPDMASKYHNKSVAEQNSLDIAWEILMEDHFSQLRQCLFPTVRELMRFRQLIVNVVLATDIMDKSLNDLRKARWARAFSVETKDESVSDMNLRATIVIEHIIQASDVSHTMQHWHVYRKWNERLFQEVYKAYLDGRIAKDPAETWYNGEIGFFDFYIIPLAKKLKDCGVFGVSSDEYLSYAQQNRNEWERKGQEVVEHMVAAVKAQAEQGQEMSISPGFARM